MDTIYFLAVMIMSSTLMVSGWKKPTPYVFLFGLTGQLVLLIGYLDLKY